VRNYEKRHHGEHRDHRTSPKAGRRGLALDKGDQQKGQAPSQNSVQADRYPADHVHRGAEVRTIQHQDVQAETWNRHKRGIQVSFSNEEDG
jgi:hypothetical protein